jgi:hypothetical protein
MRRREDNGARAGWMLKSLAGRPRRAGCLGLVLAAVGCGQTLDAGRNEQATSVIIDNDAWSDNWAGEFAVLLANSGGPTLVGIVVDASSYWPDLAANVAGWTEFTKAARASGLDHAPDITEGASTPLTVPDDQSIESTVPLRSAGAQLIVDLSRRLYLPGQPVLVVTGAQLTNLADAYLMDPSVVDRVTVVASLGSYSSPKALMTGPNGDLDPWADWIVAHKFHYVQVTVLHDQAADVTADDSKNLPKNAFGDWMAAKQPNLSKLDTAADHLAVLVAALPSFVTTATPSAPDSAAVFGSPQGQGPPLSPSATGTASVVTQVDDPLVRKRLWEMLRDPQTFGS